MIEASENTDVNVKLYMTKIGQVELLSKEREQEIGREIELARQGILTTLMSLPYGLRLVVEVQKQLEKELRGPRNTLNADFMSHIKSCLICEEESIELLEFLCDKVFDAPTIKVYNDLIKPRLGELLGDSELLINTLKSELFSHDDTMSDRQLTLGYLKWIIQRLRGIDRARQRSQTRVTKTSRRKNRDYDQEIYQLILALGYQWSVFEEIIEKLKGHQDELKTMSRQVRILA
jgi:hypothetical protein